MRFNHVAKARVSKKHRACITCREEIVAGQAYVWVQANQYSPRISWHARCAQPAASFLEPNEKRSAAMAAFETAYDSIDALRAGDDGPEDLVPDDLVSEVTTILEQCSEALNEAAELWRESAQSIEDGFGHPTTTSDELNENADTLDGLADDVTSIEGDEYDEEQFVDIEQWASGYLDSIIEQLGDVEGQLP